MPITNTFTYLFLAINISNILFLSAELYYPSSYLKLKSNTWPVLPQFNSLSLIVLLAQLVSVLRLAITTVPNDKRNLKSTFILFFKKLPRVSTLFRFSPTELYSATYIPSSTIVLVNGRLNCMLIGNWLVN